MLDKNFIEAIVYPKWVSNLIIIPKLDRWILIYIDFRYINKTFPKDDFPLPNINTLLDNSIENEMFFLMDGFFGDK